MLIFNRLFIVASIAAMSLVGVLPGHSPSAADAATQCTTSNQVRKCKITIDVPQTCMGYEIAGPEVSCEGSDGKRSDDFSRTCQHSPSGVVAKPYDCSTQETSEVCYYTVTGQVVDCGWVPRPTNPCAGESPYSGCGGDSH